MPVDAGRVIVLQNNTSDSINWRDLHLTIQSKCANHSGLSPCLVMFSVLWIFYFCGGKNRSVLKSFSCGTDGICYDQWHNLLSGHFSAQKLRHNPTLKLKTHLLGYSPHKSTKIAQMVGRRHLYLGSYVKQPDEMIGMMFATVQYLSKAIKRKRKEKRWQILANRPCDWNNRKGKEKLRKSLTFLLCFSSYRKERREKFLPSGWKDRKEKKEENSFLFKYLTPIIIVTNSALTAGWT